MIQNKTVGKLIGMKKSDFDDLIKAKEIALSKPRLIPLHKLGDELALTSVILSAIRLVREFRLAIFSVANLQKGGAVFFYTEVSFKDFPKSRLDGLILVVKSGTIRDAAILEVKNGKDELGADQIARYQALAKNYAIPSFITISNQFVTDPTQSPANTKNVRGVDLYHFSWSYLLTIAHVLLFKNDNNIHDEDQVEIMREVLNYLEAEKSGVFGLNQMKQGWVNVVARVNSGANLKVSDADVYEAALSWQQEERDMALILSRELGVLVESGRSKFRGQLEERLKADSKELVTSKRLSSVFRVRGAISDIDVHSSFEKRTVEMIVSFKPPSDKTLKGQLGWVRRQLDTCIKNDEALFSSLAKEIYIEVSLKNSRVPERYSILSFDRIYGDLKGREIREFKILYLRDFGKRFSSPKKFVEIVETMFRDYYKGIVQHLVRWEPSAPKIQTNRARSEGEYFIDEVNEESRAGSSTTPPSTALVVSIEQRKQNPHLDATTREASEDSAEPTTTERTVASR
jgi:hypothetical protein